MDAPTQNTILSGGMIAGAIAAVWAFSTKYLQTQRDRKHAREDLDSQERREATAKWQQHLTAEILGLRAQLEAASARERDLTDRLIASESAKVETERQAAKDLQLFSDAVTRLEQRLAASSRPPQSPPMQTTGNATPRPAVDPTSRPRTEPRLPAPPPLPRSPRTRS